MIDTLWIIAGVVTVLILSMGLVKVFSKSKYLTARPPYNTNDIEEEPDRDSAYDVFIDRNK
tara:strand:- start:129 stop:311 length:183 start_codon:yes stop_codon:yes gene_type:complete